MTTIAVYGANGRAGRRIVAEAARRDHDVTAVVRDPGDYRGLTALRITVVAGDVLDGESVRRVCDDADVVVNATSSAEQPETFFPDAATTLAASLRPAQRLIVVGIGTTLEVSPGLPMFESSGFPAEGIGFSVGHARELDVLRRSPDLDWLVVAPPPVLLDDTAGVGVPYTTAIGTLIASAADFSYADLALAVVDEIEAPAHHRLLLALARAAR